MAGPTKFTSEGLSEPQSMEQRLEFGIDRISKFIRDRGIDVKWEKSYLCPCRTKLTRSPDPNCTLCHGRGIAYLEPEDIKMIIQSQEKNVVSIDIGLYDSGSALGTTEINTGVTFRDRISVPKVTIKHSMLFDVDSRRFNDGFWVPYDVHSIELAVTEGGVPLKENEDFKFDYDRNLFIPKDEELIGKNISMNITSTLRYIVTDLLKESRYQDTNKGTELEEFHNLPSKLLLKREDIWVHPVTFTESEDEGIEQEEPPQISDEDPKRTTSGGGFFGGELGGW